MVRTIIYSIILVPLCGTLLWGLWTTTMPFGRPLFWIVVVAFVICTIVVIKEKVSG